MLSLARYDVMLCIMMLLPLVAMMRCLPLCAVRHTSLPQATSLAKRHHLPDRETSFKKVTFVYRAKVTFLVEEGGCSAPLDFSAVPNGCEKSALLEASQPAKVIAPLRLLARTGASHQTPLYAKKEPPQGDSFFGGRGWIRTTEVVDGRFTVCSLWPLGNSSLFSFGVSSLHRTWSW